MANVLDSIMNIIQSGVFSIDEYTKKFHDDNRMNNMGRAFEEFVKDSFTDTINESDKNTRITKQSQIFDYTGNNSNPPDAMLKGGNDGDAIEIKKIESLTSSLSLNSSFPNHKLYKNSNMISRHCKNIDNWDVRDILYVIGCTNKKTSDIKYIFMIYGMDYAADNNLYIELKRRLKDEINSSDQFDFQETNELGRLNAVDPLGITYLRMRGMWGIENPLNLFNKDYSLDKVKENRSTIIFVINNEKWKTFSNTKKFQDFVNQNDCLSLSDIIIQNPNNPMDLKDGKLIVYENK